MRTRTRSAFVALLPLAFLLALGPPGCTFNGSDQADEIRADANRLDLVADRIEKVAADVANGTRATGELAAAVKEASDIAEDAAQSASEAALQARALAEAQAKGAAAGAAIGGAAGSLAGGPAGATIGTELGKQAGALIVGALALATTLFGSKAAKLQGREEGWDQHAASTSARAPPAT